LLRCTKWHGNAAAAAATCAHFTATPATADELRAELLERAKAQTAVAYTFKSEYLGQWHTVADIVFERHGSTRRVPCVHRDGDEGIE
jgi:hypothetical protein